MRKSIPCAAAFIIMAAAPAAARSQFVAHDDGQAIRVGEGGTSISRGGVDFWTQGAPARRYQVVGMLTDNRSIGNGAGDAVGSTRLARRVRAAGGDGLILFDRQRQDDGFVGVWSGGDSVAPYQGRRAISLTTTFVVVRYLD